ncbi:uncharacterized protein LOC143284824 [Babylonia areolata]|uniref:uncharacterized protein LOC143284824 n=1 Tax=Babylonia areolata TaxID=304850 RepID=UPI003FD3BEC9
MARNRFAALVFAAILFVLFTGCKGEFCTTDKEYNVFGYTYETTYCPYDCCGTYPYQYCCGTASWLIGAIVGGVLGGIALISLIIVAICCFIKKQSHQGQVVGQAPVTHPPYTTNVAYSGTSAQYPMYPQYPAGAVPPPNYPYHHPTPAAAAAVTPETKGL